MPRARKKSDDLYNQRRRAKRAIARIEANSLATAREKAYAQSLRNLVQDSYLGRGKASVPSVKARAYEAGNLLSQRVAGSRAGAAERRNIMFRSQLGAASRKGANIAGMTRARNKIFFKATQHLWSGKGPDKLKSIQAAFGGKPLDEIYREVMSQQTDALRREFTERRGNVGGMTDDPRSMLQLALAENVDRDQGSPDYMVYVASVSPAL